MVRIITKTTNDNVQFFIYYLTDNKMVALKPDGSIVNITKDMSTDQKVIQMLKEHNYFLSPIRWQEIYA